MVTAYFLLEQRGCEVDFTFGVSGSFLSKQKDDQRSDLMWCWEYCIRSNINDCAVFQGQFVSKDSDSLKFSSSLEKEVGSKVINCD